MLGQSTQFADRSCRETCDVAGNCVKEAQGGYPIEESSAAEGLGDALVVGCGYASAAAGSRACSGEGQQVAFMLWLSRQKGTCTGRAAFFPDLFFDHVNSKAGTATRVECFERQQLFRGGTPVARFRANVHARLRGGVWRLEHGQKRLAGGGCELVRACGGGVVDIDFSPICFLITSIQRQSPRPGWNVLSDSYDSEEDRRARDLEQTYTHVCGV